MSSNELRRILHVAIVVKNIEETGEAWARLLGCEKPVAVETGDWDSTHMMLREKPAKGKAKFAFLSFDNTVLELIQPTSGESTWKDFLEKNGDGIHYLGFEVRSMKEMIDKFKDIGVNVEQKGDFDGGSYVYFDSKNSLGAIIELISKNR